MRSFHSRLLVVCFALVLVGALAWEALERATAGWVPPYRALSKLDWPAGLLFVVVLLVAAFYRRVSDRMESGRGRG
jgi:hypothetical protein